MKSKPAEETRPLSAPALNRIAKTSALVKVPGQPDRTGILLDGGGASSRRHYLVLCDTPLGLESTYVAYQTSGGIEKSSAKRMSTLDSGLSIFQFTTSPKVSFVRPGEPVIGETFHAVRLEGAGTISDAERAQLTAELETIREQRSEAQRRQSEAMRTRMQRGQMGGPRQPPGGGMEPETAAMRSEMADLSAKESKLRSRLQFPVSSLTVVETAAGPTRESMDAVGDAAGNTLLAATSGAVIAIRREGKWFDVKDLLASASNRIEEVTLRVSQSGDGVSLACSFKTSLPLTESSYSLVAATTFGLESVGSGSIEERLAQVKPVAFQRSGGDYTISRQLEWNRQKSTLWIKVFDDKEPGKPVLDEIVLLDHPEGFSARWGKPPSPLIKVRPAEPDTPEDLVKEQTVLDAKSEIRDIVAAGDGSVVMVQTKGPPYWAPLDLKTGKWLEAPWKATADTLLATQAGKIYLTDRNTLVMEIRDLASGKRDGMQLLPVEGPIIAAAAPLLDPGKPLLVATGINAFFLDPRKFEILSTGLDVESYFVEAEDSGNRHHRLKPETVWLRASHDGMFYSLSGIAAREMDSSVSRLMVTLDRSSVAMSTTSERLILPSRGRLSAQYLPDHGGSGVTIRMSSSHGQFPDSTGEIRFMAGRQQKESAVMKSPPMVPPNPEKVSGYVLPDRGAYLDSSNEVLLLPDGDKLHLVRLNLPEQENQFSGAWSPGEVVEFPLPAGTGHTLKSSLGGETKVGPKSIQWVIPPVASRTEANLKLEWTGELGSTISKDYRISIVRQTPLLTVESPDGKKRFPLSLRSVIRDEGCGIKGFAGSGHVLLAASSDKHVAWNLATGERIFSGKGRLREFLGDAGHLYVLGDNGSLDSHDIQTGKVTGQLKFQNEIAGITTGMSSRGPLLAVEREKGRPFVMLIDRDTLTTKLMDFSAENASRFFIPNFRTNAAGSTSWSANTLIQRDGRAITLKPFDDSIENGVPDASGRFIVGSKEIADFNTVPPNRIKITSFPGLSEASKCRLDESGRYLLITLDESKQEIRTASVRDLQAPGKELFKLNYPVTGYESAPRVVSASKTLVEKLSGTAESMLGVYELDIPEIIRGLSH